MFQRRCGNSKVLAQPPDAVVAGYHVDEARPDRLVRFVSGLPHGEVEASEIRTAKKH